MLYPGRFLGPSDIVKLAHVCETVCNERGVALASQDGERIAAHVLRLFMNGMTAESELLDVERNWARRPDLSREQVSAKCVDIREAA
ncbi:MAG: hypothetical protein E5Y06_30990 [Mesorhizobium sp.]|nr:MAG: hypothetical protein E5Y06_30990 [Mesorhizobium sp.]TJU94253.1 MAG: hypothetical protein E5Y08_30965 [Mesorhizobium sp.]TJV13456.1 MAG: hypothetical protein E5Y07_31375 [Mesorhizobium sp.]